MKTIKSILYLLLALFLFSGADCTTEDYEDVYMTEDFKDHVMFPVGSYWVYEDSVSGYWDTIKILSQSIDFSESFHYMRNYEMLTQKLAIGPDSTLNARTSGAKEYFGYGYYADVTMHSDHYEVVHDSVLVKSNYFYNVKEIQKITGHYNFWAKNIGLIKKVTPEGTMLLTDYYINE